MLFARYTRLGLHLLRGVLTVATCCPWSGQARREALRERWTQGLLKILGIRVQWDGPGIAPGTLLVANHVSWADILVLHARVPACFVSKADVREWPLIGWLAAHNGTIFLRRGSRGHARIVNQEIADALRSGRIVAIFPEGTTTDGSHLLHFHAALLQPAIDAGCPVQALALCYEDGAGQPSRAAAYDGDVTLGESLSRILHSGGLVARLYPLSAYPTIDGVERRILAHTLHDDIAQRLDIPSHAKALPDKLRTHQAIMPPADAPDSAESPQSPSIGSPASGQAT